MRSRGRLKLSPDSAAVDSYYDASMMKLVDIGDLKSPAFRRAGSTPARGTIIMLLMINKTGCVLGKCASLSHAANKQHNNGECSIGPLAQLVRAWNS